jgi:hypothetical protein
MKKKTIEDIKFYVGASLVLEVLSLLYIGVPPLVLQLQGKPLGKYSNGWKMCLFVIVIFVITLITYLLVIKKLKERHSDAANFLGGVNILFEFLFRWDLEGAKTIAGGLSKGEVKKSNLIRHFSRKINLVMVLIAVFLSFVLFLAIGTFLLMVLYGDTSGMRLFDRHYGRGEQYVLLDCTCMVVVSIWLIILDLAALIRIRVSTNGLKEDIIDSEIPLSVLDEEFKKSTCIGHDIWVGEEHIFLSAGRESYMFRKDKIFDIRCERVMWNWRLFFLPVYRIIITGEGGIRQASFFTLRKGVYERLKNAVE